MPAILQHSPFARTKPPAGCRVDRSHPLSRGLVGLWPFSEAGGFRASDSAGQNVGTLNGGVTWGANTRDRALSFDGTGFVNAGASQAFDVTQFTMAVWINPTNVTQNAGLIGKYSNSTTLRAYVLYLGQDAANNRMTFRVRQTNSTDISLVGTTGLTAKTWYHVVCVADGSNLNMYINTVRDAGGPIAYNNTIVAITNPFLLGKLRSEDSVYPYTGAMDVAAFWNRPLSAVERLQLYNEPFAMLRGPDVYRRMA